MLRDFAHRRPLLVAALALSLGACRTTDSAEAGTARADSAPAPLTLRTVHAPTGSDALHNPLEKR